MDVNAYRFTSELDAIYGDSPISLHFFLKVTFGTHGADGHEHHHG
jgi:hypothetical protein